MGGPGVESLAPGGVPPAPQPLTPSGRETLASTGSQGLLLCTEQAEAGVMATAQDRITIYGPKDDGTYIKRPVRPNVPTQRTSPPAPAPSCDAAACIAHDG